MVRDPDPEEPSASIDWSRWYLTDGEDMGEGNEQNQIARLLGSSDLVPTAEEALEAAERELEKLRSRDD